MFIGDGAKMVRDAFALAKEKSPCIIFIDEIDSIGERESAAGQRQQLAARAGPPQSASRRLDSSSPSLPLTF